MTIESLLKEQNEKLDRIAVALESIVESQGIVAGTVAPRPAAEADDDLDIDDDVDLDDLEDAEAQAEADDDLDDMDDDDLEDDLDDDDLEDDLDDDDLDEEPAPASKKKIKKKVSKKKVTKKKVAKKKTSKKTTVGKKTGNKKAVTKEQVRTALKDLQLVSGSQAEAKSILKANGASTFGQLDAAKYRNVVVAAKKALGEYE